MASETRRKDELPGITESIVETYQSVGTINHLDHSPLPRYEEVITALDDMREILFPGYRRREGLHLGNVGYYIGDLIDGLHDRLIIQISRAMAHESRVRGEQNDESDPAAGHEARAQEITLELLSRIPDMRRLLATDVQAAYDGDPACQNLDEVIFCYPGLEAVTVYRIAHELYKLEVPFIPRMLCEWAHKETGIDIHPGATIGDHFFIDHGTGVVIGETTEIGSHVKIYQGVTLGALSFPTDADGNIIRTMKRHPTIEDRVVIYASATILGGKTVIGHDSVVGSSVWLTRSVDPHTTVMLEKPSLRMRNEVPDPLNPDTNFQI
ncbi:MAG: serine acetyltransferase [Pirellulaceae bacterium]